MGGRVGQVCVWEIGWRDAIVLPGNDLQQSAHSGDLTEHRYEPPKEEFETLQAKVVSTNIVQTDATYFFATVINHSTCQNNGLIQIVKHK